MPPPHEPTTAEVSELDALAHAYWESRLDESPVAATRLGDRRCLDRMDDADDAAHDRRKAIAEGFLARLRALPVPEAGTEGGLTWRVLELTLRREIEGYDHRGWEWEVDQIFGLHVALPNLMTLQPLEDEGTADALLRRLSDVPRAFDEHITNLREGLARGRTVPRLVVARVVKQLDGFLRTAPERTPFVRVPEARLPVSVNGAFRVSWSAELVEVVRDEVCPSYARYLAFLRDVLMPAARDAPGIHAMPGGAEEYAYRVRRVTTTDLTPQEIHEIGLEELEKNRAEMLEIARAEGHTGSLESFLAGMREDARFRCATREEILERYRAICARMDAALPRVFSRFPRTGYVVQPVEEYREKDAPAAYYQRPPEDGSRPGIFFANTHDPTSWPTYDFEPLCFHEAVPGHHFQIALAQEIEGLPAFRRQGGFTAYLEGWAHYTERLADEMGMYSTAYDRMGMLSAQAWRAVRLVVDTGIHELGWPRERALELMRSIRTGPDQDAQNEVDRYIAWPGQALAYKVGSRKITELRDACRERIGARFDLKAFHDEVLRHGALPLTLLEETLVAWSPGA